VTKEGIHGIMDLKRLLWSYFTSTTILIIEAKMGGAAKPGI
jgi:hypothetical protein